MIYEIHVKNNQSPTNIMHTHNMEVARSIIKERFFGNLNMEEAVDVGMDATETDTTKTGIVMSFRVKTKSLSVSGTVTAIKDEDFFTEEWNSDILFPKSFNVNFI